jgi:hypothetical protein
MPANEGTDTKAVAAVPTAVPTMVPIGPGTSIDLSFLPEQERAILLRDHAKGILDIGRKAAELHVDVGVLKSTLNSLASTTKEVSDAGNAVTISHTQSTPIGRTEIMMGNTDQAAKGKLTKTQTGERDWTPYYIFGGLIAFILVAAILFGHK